MRGNDPFNTIRTCAVLHDMTANLTSMAQSCIPFNRPTTYGDNTTQQRWPTDNRDWCEFVIATVAFYFYVCHSPSSIPSFESCAFETGEHHGHFISTRNQEEQKNKRQDNTKQDEENQKRGEDVSSGEEEQHEGTRRTRGERWAGHTTRRHTTLHNNPPHRKPWQRPWRLIQIQRTTLCIFTINQSQSLFHLIDSTRRWCSAFLF